MVPNSDILKFSFQKNNFLEHLITSVHNKNLSGAHLKFFYEWARGVYFVDSSYANIKAIFYMTVIRGI